MKKLFACLLMLAMVVTIGFGPTGCSKEPAKGPAPTADKGKGGDKPAPTADKDKGDKPAADKDKK